MGLNGEKKDDWISLLEQAGFINIISNLYPTNQRKQVWGDLELQRIGFFNIWGRFIYYYVRDPEYRKSVHYFAKEGLRIPRDFTRYFGFGLYVCRK